MTLKNQVETFYKSTTNIKTEFCIDIDSLFKDDETGKMIPIWQWSGYSTKEKAVYKTKQLVEEIDYKVHKDVKLQGSKTGQKINQYLFTKDGFKHFLLMSNTYRGQQIRNYFIDVEKRYGREIAQATPLDKAIA